MNSVITFNPIKHHLKHIEAFIRDYRDDLSVLRKYLLMVGNSQMDMYTGSLSIHQISTEITCLLKKQVRYERFSYLPWLHEQGGYRALTLSDNSVWVLREGVKEEKYIHIHPGRYSPHTLRVKASTLKTAIATLCMAKNSCQKINLSLVNNIRTNVLNLSPQRQILPEEGVGKLLLLFKAAFPTLFDD